jgi:hypothetical protein
MGLSTKQRSPPDHPKIKTVAKVFEKVAKVPNFDSFANFEIVIILYIEELYNLSNSGKPRLLSISKKLKRNKCALKRSAKIRRC